MDRKSKYALIKSLTGNTELARKGRNWGQERIDREIVSMYRSIEEASPKRNTRGINRKIKYDKARNAGYSPVEATKMQDWSNKHLNDIVKNHIIVNKSARRQRWKSMSRRRAVDPESEILARRLNTKKGLDKDHSFGWSIAYYVYTEGVDPEKWFKSVKIDPFIPEVYRLPNTVSF